MSYEELIKEDIQEISKKIVKTFWLIFFVSLFFTAVGITATFFIHREMVVHNLMYHLIIPHIIFLTLIFVANFFTVKLPQYSSFSSIIICTLIPLISTILYPEISGIQNVLFISILVSALFLQIHKIMFSLVLTTLSLLLLYFLHPTYNSLLNIHDLLASFAIFICCTLVAVLMLKRGSDILKRLTDNIQEQQDLIVQNAIKDKLNKLDPLTQLYNHRTFHEYLEKLIEQNENYDLPLCLAIIDIDNFKKINDTYGHWTGDLILKRVAETLKNSVSPDDFVSRFGGEEFSIILTERNLQACYLLLDQLRELINNEVHEALHFQSISVSIGLAEYQKGMGKERFFKETDSQLYAAKKSGKNCVCFHNKKDL